MTNRNNEIVFIIDDDIAVRRSLSLFLTASGYQVVPLASAEEYLEHESHIGPGCIILDVNLEGKNGLELQDDLIAMNSALPIIFITGRGDIHMSVIALKKGAVNFLEKPFNDDELLQAISEGLELSRKLTIENEEIRNSQSLIKTLTPREHEVLSLVAIGLLNKQIGGELGIAEHTVKLHRHSICEKLGVKSVPEIIRIADKAGVLSSD